MSKGLTQQHPGRELPGCSQLTVTSGQFFRKAAFYDIAK
jgi:hypothetical protein